MTRIEIMNRQGGCPMKCLGCPKGIQSLQGSYADLIPKAYQLLATKLDQNLVSFAVHFAGTISETLPMLDYYAKQNPTEVICTTDLATVEVELKSLFAKMLNLLPEADLTLTVPFRQLNYLPEETTRIIKIARSFWEGKCPSLYVGFVNNWISTEIYNNSENLMMSRDKIFYGAIQKGLGDVWVNYSFDDNPERFQMYSSLISYSKERRYFSVGRRILSVCTDKTLTLDDYRERTMKNMTDVTIKNMYFALTPIGVRINHDPSDINNPFLWIQYDELFQYLASSISFEKFFKTLKQAIVKSVCSDIENYSGVVTEELIQTMAKKRI
jgi:hypothetical protein